MKFLLVLLLYVFMENSSVDAMHYGEYHSITDFPYMAQLLSKTSKKSRNFCGAAILSEYWVITATHCISDVYSNSSAKIIVGSSLTTRGGKSIDIDKIFVYPGFLWQLVSPDFCLIKLKTPIEFNEYQQPIQISKSFPDVGTEITVSGFGYHKAGIFGYALRSGKVQLMENNACTEILTKLYSKDMNHEKHFCTNSTKVELCSGDSGIPAVFNNKLIGIFNIGCEYHIPSYFTKIPSFYDWVLEITGIKYTD